MANESTTNLMRDAVAQTERAHAEYARMESNLAAVQNDRDELKQDNELLRAEVGRCHQRYEEMKDESEKRILAANEDRDRYMRFAVEMTAQLAIIDKLMTAQAGAMSEALKHAVAASKVVAFNKPIIKTDTEDDKHLRKVVAQIEGQRPNFNGTASLDAVAAAVERAATAEAAR
jgi:hypothetical protein